MHAVESILALGTSGSVPEGVSRHVRVANAISLLGIVLSLASVPFDLVVGPTWFLLSDIVALAGFASCWMLNAAKHPSAARTVMLLTTNAVFVYATITLGEVSDQRLAFFALAVVPFLVFDFEERVQLTALVLIPIGGYFACELVEPRETRFSVPAYRLYSAALTFGALIVSVVSFARANRRAERAAARTRAEAHAELERKVEARTTELARSLGEKEVLLREVHHRVKNNLQVVWSLLHLQLAKEPSEAARKALLDSQSRIQSMALVHQLLYRSNDLARLDFGEYLRSLATKLFESYQIEDRVEMHVTAVPVLLDLDRAVPCGLIVNELVANALEHAFPGDRRGHLWVTLASEGQQLVLSVRDDGIGLPSGIDVQGAQTFGLRIALMLTEQLEGTITLVRGEGTEIRVTFSVPS